MTRRGLACLLLLASLSAGPARADNPLEIVTLRHRPAEQVVPALRPLVEPDGALSSMGDKILLRVSPRNLADLRAAIAALDTPIRRLIVSVRQGAALQEEGGGIGVAGRLAPGNSRIVVEGGVTGAGARDDVSQQVQVIEGGRAQIRVGRALPLALREWRAAPGGWVPVEAVRYVDVGTGFDAVPQVVGERVTIEISPSMARLEEGGSIQATRLATTVSGPLGAWIPLGGSSAGTDTTRYGTTGYTQGSQRSDAQVWLRVDALE